MLFMGIPCNSPGIDRPQQRSRESAFGCLLAAARNEKAPHECEALEMENPAQGRVS